jgi:hypothetical protein
MHLGFVLTVGHGVTTGQDGTPRLAGVAKAARVNSAQAPVARGGAGDAAEPPLPRRPRQRSQPESQRGERQVLHHVQL